LFQQSRIRVIGARTGEFLSDLILDPQEQHQTPSFGEEQLGRRDGTL
jgi:hypothetical protein